MKRIVSLFVVFVLFAAMMLGLISCSNDDFVMRKENEITYYLPKDFTEKNYEGIPLCYANNEAAFILTVWGRDELKNSWDLPSDFDIIRFTDEFMDLNDYQAGAYTYDEARGVTTLFAYATEYEDSDDIDLFCNLLALTDDYAYIVTLHCDEAYASKYTPLFEDILSRIEIN